jgi:hypothetical protein
MADENHNQNVDSKHAKLSGGAEAGIGGDEQGEGMPLALGGGGKGGSGKTDASGENRPNTPDASRH